MVFFFLHRRRNVRDAPSSGEHEWTATREVRHSQLSLDAATLDVLWEDRPPPSSFRRIGIDIGRAGLEAIEGRYGGE